MQKGTKAIRVSWRLWFALLVTFFPVGILFPLQYPLRETVTLLAWIWALPSIPGIAGLLLVPLFSTETYGYWAFNMFCVLGTIGTGYQLAQSSNLSAAWPWRHAYRIARGCMVVTFILATWQGLDGDTWLRAFPAMESLGDGRGSGFRTEPSLVAPCLALYLGLAVMQFARRESNLKSQKRLMLEAAVFTLLSIVLTRSFSVILVAACFLPAIGLKLRQLTVGALLGLVTGLSLMWTRLDQAISSGGDWTFMITTGVSSWRNIPDLLILMNARNFLLPPHPGDVRNTINTLAALWNPDWAWLENTYSTFSALAMTVGLVATAILFCGGIVFAARRITLKSRYGFAWILIYLANWIVLPKYEASGWVALALITLAAQIRETGQVRANGGLNPILVPRFQA